MEVVEDSTTQVEEESFHDIIKRWRSEMESFLAKENVSCCPFESCVIYYLLNKIHSVCRNAINFQKMLCWKNRISGNNLWKKSIVRKYKHF